MNNIVLSGRISKDIELKQSQTGKNYVHNSIAVRRNRKNKSGEYETDFFNFEIWGSNAEFLANYAKKGGRIEIAGELQNSNFQKKDGQMIYRNKILVNRLGIIDYAGESQPQTQQQPFQPQQTFEQPAMSGFGTAMQQTAPNAGIGENDLPF